MELDHIATLLHAVEVDIGLALVPAAAVENRRFRESLKAIPIIGDVLSRPLGILYRKGRSFSIATQKLLEVLTKKNQQAEAAD